MDFINKLASGEMNNGNNGGNNQQRNGGQQSSSEDSNQNMGGFMDNIKDKLNSAAGGGREGEKDEDLLDKGVDFVQEKFLNQGKQDNESALEQAKDEQISDYIRKEFKNKTGFDVPIEDKKTTFD